jgi:hypothetical protein
MHLATLRPSQVFLLAGLLAAGLVADVVSGVAGQMAIGAAFYAALFLLCRRRECRERRALIACLVIATGGELFLSQAWGVYDYRLGNVPMFVPPGHVMMYLLAAELARRMSEGVAKATVAAAGVYAVAGAATGFDGFAVLLFLGLAIAAWAMPRDRRLLASTMALSLALELYGTWLGVWTWRPNVPYLGLTTTNPPALSGALYVVRDAGVALASAWFARGAAEVAAPSAARS